MNLTGNYVGDTSAASLAEAMRVNKTLTQLDLSYNNIGDTGATSLAEAVKFNATLTKLASGAASLTEAKKVNTMVEVIFVTFDLP